MSETTVRLTNLNDTDYAKWSMKMEAILIWCGLWSMVNLVVSKVDADGKEKDMSRIAAELGRLMKLAPR